VSCKTCHGLRKLDEGLEESTTSRNLKRTHLYNVVGSFSCAGDAASHVGSCRDCDECEDHHVLHADSDEIEIAVEK
jgi:hypothetical protein